MTLEIFLENHPKLVEKLKCCEDSESVEKILKQQVSEEELKKIDVSDLQELSDEDLSNVSVGVAKILSGASMGLGLGMTISEIIFNLKVPFSSEKRPRWGG